MDPSLLEHKLKSLIKTRQYTRSKVTRLCNKIDNEIGTLNSFDRQAYLNRINALNDELKQIDKDFLSLCVELDRPEEELDNIGYETDTYDEMIAKCIALLDVRVQTSNDRSDILNSSYALNPHLLNKPRLPEIPLPTFSNQKGENLSKFFMTFESIVDRHNLSDYEKFLYLKKQLKGSALILVDTLDIDQLSYFTAKKLLQEAFDSTVNSKYEIITLLSDLYLPKNSDPYRFIGDMRTVLSGIRSLSITVSDIVQFFIWKGLNSSFQSHLTMITNKSKPNLEEIENNIFEATQRYLKEMGNVVAPNYAKPDKFNNKPNVSNNALNVQMKPKPFCVLCKYDKKDFEHKMELCSIYVTPKDKFDKLRSMNGCTKCSFASHDSKACKFKFKSNCRYCQGPHMSYLCLKPRSKNENKNSPDVQPGRVSTQNNLSITEAAPISGGGSMILPTFSANILGKDFELPVRIFKDSGCQHTFICESLAEFLNLPVINGNLSLTIKGFNSDRVISTKIVKIEVVLNGQKFCLNAICIDNIKTKFSAIKLETVVDAFKENGYKIADENFSSGNFREINNLDLVIGTDADHILPMKYVTFGNTNDPNGLSSFIDSSIGVIFSGNVEKMVNNLRFLPKKGDTSKGISNSDLDVLPLSHKQSLEGDCWCASGGVDGEESESQAGVNSSSCENVGKNRLYSRDDECNFDNLNDTDLNNKYKSILNIPDNEPNPVDTETNLKLFEYVLEHTKRDEDGFLVMPIMWNAKNTHLLSQNYNLSLGILKSSRKKLSNDIEKLSLYDDVIKDQENLNIIERIENLDRFLEEHPESSFLPHMGVFRMSHDSTKCRVVFLSNMNEKTRGISHNKAMLSGPNLNPKISTAVIMNRFDKYMFIFDIKKAFLNIKLYENDQNRLCFLWFKNVRAGDFSVVGYKNLRLCFGLKPSPTLLMIGLYKMLISDRSDDIKINNLKEKLYNTIYMDNGSYSTNNSNELDEAFNSLEGIFSGYNMGLQQFSTNKISLQNKIDFNENLVTPETVKYFGMLWNRKMDSLSPYKINLDTHATTKRKVLATLNTVYDIFGVYHSVLLRAKLFMQKLQCDPRFKWDTILPDDLLKEWILIAKQANATPIIEFSRNIGPKNGNYSLIAFSDSSKLAMGTVIYIKDLNSNNISYLFSKSRLLNSASKRRSMPSLEFQAITLAVETLHEIKESLCGEKVVIPINIKNCFVFTDSLVCLHWLRAYAIQFDKMQKVSVFIKNKLGFIDQVCRKTPMTFLHVSGNENPSDILSRPTSYKIFSKSNFLKGPEVISSNFLDFYSGDIVTVPNKDCMPIDEVFQTSSNVATANSTELPYVLNSVFKLENYSSLSFVLSVYYNILKFINKLKIRLVNKNKERKFQVYDEGYLHKVAILSLISFDQIKVISRSVRLFEFRRKNQI